MNKWGNPASRAAVAGVAGLFLGVVGRTVADPPSDYYDSVDATNSTMLRTTLHAIIDDHTRFPYTSNSIDTWDT